MSAKVATRIQGHHYLWEIEKANRAFRSYVIEPESYDPPAHSEIFRRTLSTLVSPPQPVVTGFEAPANIQTPEDFDLATFPEAFLPVDVLIEALESVAGLPHLGGIHVGLRPAADKENHLFSVTEIDDLLKRIAGASNVEKDDTTQIAAWLATQPAYGHYNLACLFLVDAHGKTRVCVHPKMVRSKVEFSVLPEAMMSEGTVLSLVTLMPANRTFLSVTVQPIICSDALLISTDHGAHPLCGITQYAAAFKEPPPDHVDIVSIAMCTEQAATQRQDGTVYHSWHQLFRRTFEAASAQAGFERHRFATFLMSNFRKSVGKKQGGLSGGYLPVPLRAKKLPRFAQCSFFGRPPGATTENEWSEPSSTPDASMETRGYITQLDPTPAQPCEARVFGFTLSPLPRHESLWNKPQGFGSLDLRSAVRKGDANQLLLEHLGGSDV